ncbi:MAG: NADPH:quinone reductase [Actinomycetes bacterium]
MLAAAYSQRGSADEVLAVREVPDPVVGPGEVRVRIHTSGVNPTDWKSRSAGAPIEDYLIPNQDGAGIIDQVGAGVDPSRLGQRVWVFHAAWQRTNGTAAQFTALPAGQAVPLPDTIGFDQGAGLGIPYITAHGCLYGDGPIDGLTVLVAAGAGAVGHAAIELAVFGGARVIATVSSQEKAQIARAAGAHVVVNYRDCDAAAQIAAAAPGGVDRIIEVALGANLELDLAVLKPHGVIVTYANEPTDPTIPVRTLMFANTTLRFVIVYLFTGQQIASALDAISAALAAGQLSSLPTLNFDLGDIAAAHRAVESGFTGKVLVHVE